MTPAADMDAPAAAAQTGNKKDFCLPMADSLSLSDDLLTAKKSNAHALFCLFIPAAPLL